MTANLLGQVDQLTGPWDGGPLSVWTPTGRRPFPEHLLGKEVGQHGAVLPALLESLPLAMLTAAAGKTGEFEAYMRLLDLGTPGHQRDGSVDEYGEVNSELLQWVLRGETASPDPTTEEAPQPRGELAGVASGGPEERREALFAALESYTQDQRGVAEQKVTPNTSVRLGRAWEISPMAIKAAEQLTASIAAIEVDATPENGTWG